MISNQQSMSFSPYMDLYDLIVPKDNVLQKINDLVDFTFVFEELKDNYCHDNGRNAIDPIHMFKYLLLKFIYDLTDIDIVERSKYDLPFKYFLDTAPEEAVIKPISLTKFRKLRLKDINLLDLLINKTVEIAIEKETIKNKIEAKNSELKHRNGYDVAKSLGLIGMELQDAMATFAVNLKRILKLMD